MSSVDRLGQRILFLASATTIFVAFIIVTGLSGSFAKTGNAAPGIAVILFLFIFFVGYDIAQLVLGEFHKSISIVLDYLIDSTCSKAPLYWLHTQVKSGPIAYVPAASCR